MRRDHAENLAWDILREYSNLEIRIEQAPGKEDENYGWFLTINGHRVTSPSTWTGLRERMMYESHPLPDDRQTVMQSWLDLTGSDAPPGMGEDEAESLHAHEWMDPLAFHARRKEMGMSQDELARALGVTATTVARWERGERAIPPFLRLALDQLALQVKR